MKIIIAGAVAVIILSAVDAALFDGRYFPAAMAIVSSIARRW